MIYGKKVAGDLFLSQYLHRFFIFSFDTKKIPCLCIMGTNLLIHVKL
jgi:hypothetical protein